MNLDKLPQTDDSEPVAVSVDEARSFARGYANIVCYIDICPNGLLSDVSV